MKAYAERLGFQVPTQLVKSFQVQVSAVKARRRGNLRVFAVSHFSATTPIRFFNCGQVRVLATSALVRPPRRACRTP